MLKFYIPSCDRARNEQKITSSRAALAKITVHSGDSGEKKLPHGPRDAYIFHSVEKTARLVLHQRYNSSWGEGGTRATRCIVENATAWSLGIIYNFERRGQRENVKVEGLFNNAAGLYLTNPCSAYIFLNTRIYILVHCTNQIYNFKDLKFCILGIYIWYSFVLSSTWQLG